jgi:hypothetical protein
MSNLYIKAAFVVGVFLILRFLHMKYVEKSVLPPSQFFKDGVLCFLATIGGLLMYQNLYSVVEHMNENTPKVFTDIPNFGI